MLEENVDSFVKSSIPKSPCGIEGLDEITGGGLPKGRPTLVVGGPGTGKTLLGIEFIVNGIIEYQEPGVYVSFEETPEELTKNVASLGYDLKDLIRKGMLVVEHIKTDPTEIIETGEYDLEGLFVRLNYAIESIGAKRIGLDTLEVIFSSFQNTFILRSEFQRLFRWLKEKGITAIVTAERGENSLTRNGLEEYVSDCVILLDQRIRNELVTRRLRILKFRGSAHGTNEYPFMIDEGGFHVLPITSVGLNAEAFDERVSSGISDLDEMFDNQGYFKGSSILITGGPGTGKTSLAAEFALAACKKGLKVLFFTFEESRNQIIRNMKSIGLDLQPYIDEGALQIKAERPTLYGLEMHLVVIQRMIRQFKPDVVIVDPMTALLTIGDDLEVKTMLVRLVDYLKMKGITSMFTDLIHEPRNAQPILVSSLVDTWIKLDSIEGNGELNRVLWVIKSRGMNHSNQVREYFLDDQGIHIVTPYLGSSGVLTGSARYVQESRERVEEEEISQKIERLKLQLKDQKARIDSQIIALQAEYASREQELSDKLAAEKRRKSVGDSNRRYMSKGRGGKEGESGE